MTPPEVKRLDHTAKPAVRKPVATPAQSANGSQNVLYCNSKSSHDAIFCALTSSSVNEPSFTTKTKVNPIDQKLTQDALNDISAWSHEMVKKAAPYVQTATKASGEFLAQIPKDIASIPNFKPNTAGMRFDTGYNLSSTPGANGEFTLQNPLANAGAKPARITPQAVVPAVKPHAPLASAQKAQAEKQRLETTRQQWTEGKMEGFARKYWEAHYPNLPYGAEAAKKVVSLAKAISDYENPAIKPLNVKFKQKFSDEFYSKHAAKVEEYINAHPEIQDKNAFRNLFYATLAQESSFRPNTVTLFAHIPDKFAKTVNGLRTKQSEYSKAVADLNQFPPEKVAELKRQYDEKIRAFTDKYHISLTNNQIIDTRLTAVKTRLDSFKPYTVLQSDRDFLGNIEKQKATGAKISLADARKAALIQQRVAKADASEKRRIALNEQFSALTALKQVAGDKTRAESAAKRKADNVLSEQDKFKAQVLGEVYDEAQAGVKSHKYKSLAVALTQILQNKYPGMYAQAEANGTLVMTKTQQDLIDQIHSLKQITDKTPEQEELLKRLQARLGNSEHPASIQQINRGYMQDEIQELLNNPNRTEDQNKRLAALQQKEKLNILNEALSSAKGIGQVIDENCYLFRDKSQDKPGFQKEINPFDVDQNIYASIAELADISGMAARRGLRGENQVRYVACAYNGGPGRANENCLPNGVFPSDPQHQNLPEETKIHIGKVSQYFKAYDAIFTNARDRRKDYTDKLRNERNELINAINTTDSFAQETFQHYIAIGQQLDATHKPVPVKKDLRPNSWTYLMHRFGWDK